MHVDLRTIRFFRKQNIKSYKKLIYDFCILFQPSKSKFILYKNLISNII